MVEHQCMRCNKIFNKKSTFKYHINRKIKCNERKYTLNCVYCKKAFTTKSSVTRHLKNSCKVIKQQEIEKKQLSNKLKILEEENNKLKKEYNKLKYIQNSSQQLPNIVKSKKLTYNLPKRVRYDVWERDIGKNKPIGYCYVNRNHIVTFTNFHCGHVISRKNNGSNTIDNLRVICSECNLSMGSRNLEYYKNEFYGNV